MYGALGISLGLLYASILSAVLGMHFEIQFNEIFVMVWLKTWHNLYNGMAKKEKKKWKLGKRRVKGKMLFNVCENKFCFCISKSLPNWIVLDIFSDLSLVKLLCDDTGVHQPHVSNWYFMHSVYRKKKKASILGKWWRNHNDLISTGRQLSSVRVT